MKEKIAPLALLSILLLVSPSQAQEDVASRVTGIEAPAPERGGPGVDPSQLNEYLRAVKALDLSVDIEARNQVSRQGLTAGADALHVDAKWARRPGQDSPVLESLTLKPGQPSWLTGILALPQGPSNQTVEVPGVGRLALREVTRRSDGVELRLRDGRKVRVHPNGEVEEPGFFRDKTLRKPDRIGGKLNKVTIDSRGEIHLDVAGLPDVTVEKVTRERDGTLRLHVGGVLGWFSDITVSPTGKVRGFGRDLGQMEMLTRIKSWPPRLDELTALFQNPSGTANTGHDALIRYQVRGETDPIALPSTTLKPGTAFEADGALEMRPDGSIRTVGDGGRMTVRMVIGPQAFRVGSASADQTHLEGARGEGQATFAGRYRVNIPAGGGLELEADGRVDYDLRGREVRLSLPSGTKVRAGNAHLVGTAGVTLHNGKELRLVDGTYRFDTDGPLTLERLILSQVQVQDVVLNGSTSGTGTLSSDEQGNMRVRGSGRGDLTVAPDSTGVVDVLAGKRRLRGTPDAGTRVRFDAAETELVVTAPAVGRGSQFVRQEVAGSAQLEGTLSRVSLGGSAETVTAERVRIDANLEGRMGAPGGVTDARGRVEATLETPGTLTLEGLPGLPVVPTAGGGARDAREVSRGSGQRSHTVVAGETLWALSRRYGVSVADLKAANGRRDDTLRVGEVLRIPGGAPASGGDVAAAPVVAPAPAAGDAASAPPRLEVGLGAGSRMSFEVTSAKQGPRGVEVEGRLGMALEMDLDPGSYRAGGLEATIIGHASAAMKEHEFRYADGAFSLGRVEVPLNLKLRPGTRVTYRGADGRLTEVSLDREGSSAKLVAIVEMVANERPRILGAEQVDVTLVTSAPLRIGNDMARVSGEKTVRFQGRAAVLPRGLDLFGDLTVRVHGDDRTPIVSIRW